MGDDLTDEPRDIRASRHTSNYKYISVTEINISDKGMGNKFYSFKVVPQQKLKKKLKLKYTHK